ncbi:MAG: hypothetical protein JWM59_2980 [Verrucomicrobiales bacterium]|nr:hypothetical protein [Verrucomicrobiales bacterium]
MDFPTQNRVSAPTPALPNWTAFQADRLFATGSPDQVAAAVKTATDHGKAEGLLVFEDATGRTVDLDLRGTVQDVLARLSLTKNDTPSIPSTSAAARGRGRPKLGVTAREITLLPRHWEWLAEQPGGASVVIRRLVETARLASVNAGADRQRKAREATYRFMTTMAGNLPGYEEAIRALFAGHSSDFFNGIQPWPGDIRHYIQRLAETAFEEGFTLDQDLL